jgi:hypothetical protein
MTSLGQPIDVPPDPFDAAGKWLAAPYQLISRDRDQVKTATIRGQLADPLDRRRTQLRRLGKRVGDDDDSPPRDEGSGVADAGASC